MCGRFARHLDRQCCPRTDCSRAWRQAQRSTMDRRAYTVAFASFLLSAGTAGDRFGNKQVFAVGFLLFTIASVVCGAAGTLPALIGARIVQGIGAPLLIPCSLTLLNHAYDNPIHRTKAFPCSPAISLTSPSSRPP